MPEENKQKTGDDSSPQKQQGGSGTPDDSPKIWIAEAIFVSLLLFFEWLAEVFIFLITLGAGIMISETMNVATGFCLEVYLFLRGAKGYTQLLVPIFGTILESSVFIPGKLITYIFVVVLINFPKIAALFEKVAGVATDVAIAVATEGAGTAAEIAAKSGTKAAAAGGKMTATAAKSASATATQAEKAKIIRFPGKEEFKGAAKDFSKRVIRELPQNIPQKEEEEELPEAA